MSDIIYNLRRQNFPDNLRAALTQIEKCINPKQNHGNEELAQQIVDEFIFQQTSRKGPKKKLSSMHELQIMEHLLQYFMSKNNETTHQQMFRALFTGSVDVYKLSLLGKLISMAIGVGCSSVLNAAAVWMQLKGCSSDMVCGICEILVEDYFLLVSEVRPCMQKLPTVSSHFTSNFITAVTGTYHPAGSKSGKIVPEALLRMLCEWVANDSRLCLATLCQSQGYNLQPHRTNLWTSPTKPNTQTPTPGLIRWCVQAPLLHIGAVREVNNKYESSKDSVFAAKESELWRVSPLWSRLHLSVLETMLQLPTLHGHPQLELLTLIDMKRIVKDLVATHTAMQALKLSSTELPYQQVAADRLAQVLQVSLATGAFRCSMADLRKCVNSLPPSPLIALIEQQHLSTSAPQMHNVG